MSNGNSEVCDDEKCDEDRPYEVNEECYEEVNNERMRAAA